MDSQSAVGKLAKLQFAHRVIFLAQEKAFATLFKLVQVTAFPSTGICFQF
jgi:hypothetical protein